MLSAIIVVALKGMFIQTRDFRVFFAKSRMDGFLWLGTFLGVVLTNVDIGLVIAVALTIFVMAYRYPKTIYYNRQTYLSIVYFTRSYDISVVEQNESTALLKTSPRINSLNTVILTIRGVMTFANVSSILKKSRKVLRKKINKVRPDSDNLKKVYIVVVLSPSRDSNSSLTRRL